MRDDKEEYLLLNRHYQRLLNNRNFRESELIFIPENNLGMESAHLETMVHDTGRVTTFWQTDKRAGVCKTEAVTREYQFLLNTNLASGTLRFDADLFTVTRDKTPQCMLDMLREQMERFHWVCKKANSETGKDKYTLTGKMGSAQDDMIVAVMMSVYWPRVIMSKRNS